MSKSKAQFKAMRELLGMSQQLLADLLSVDVRSVKRWESPTATAYKSAPDDAWELLDKYLEQQQWAVETGLQKVEETEDQMGRPPREVSLTYWFSEEAYEAAHPGEGRFWQMANANSRIVAAILRMDGYTVNFDFPGLKSLTDLK